MSTSDLYVLNGKSTRHWAEFQNGWGSGPVVWDHLSEKYLGRKSMGLSTSEITAVWRLANCEKLSHYEKVSLMMTFDGAFVPLDQLEDAAAACALIARDTAVSGQVNHWARIGASLLEVNGVHLTRHARGIALSCTSVSDPWSNPSVEHLAGAWSIYA